MRYNQGLCACGNVQTSAGKYKGKRIYHKDCHSCRKNKDRNYMKKDACELCGFVALHKMQLDIDHIDGNHANNDSSNLQTLCANCHRLKTYQNKDYMQVVL